MYYRKETASILAVNQAYETVEEIHKGIMKSNKILFVGFVAYFLVKECLELFCPQLINLLIVSCLKVLVPLLKKNCHSTDQKISLPPDEFKNYQPVSGLCFISKLVERVIALQLND